MGKLSHAVFSALERKELGALIQRKTKMEMKGGVQPDIFLNPSPLVQSNKSVGKMILGLVAEVGASNHCLIS